MIIDESLSWPLAIEMGNDMLRRTLKPLMPFKPRTRSIHSTSLKLCRTLRASGITILFVCNVHYGYAMNMIVKPDVLQSPAIASQPTSPQGMPVATMSAPQPNINVQTMPPVPVPPVPTPPPPPPAPPTENSVTIINAAPFLMNVRFETSNNPSVIDSIPGNTSKKVTHKINTLIMYSFEQLASKPITPDMIVQDVVTIKTPPELMPAPTPVAPAPVAAAPIKSALSDTTPVSAPPMIVPTPQLPASASSKGPPGYKAERQ